MTEDGNFVDTVYIFPGIYRETIVISESGTADFPKDIMARGEELRRKYDRE